MSSLSLLFSLVAALMLLPVSEEENPEYCIGIVSSLSKIPPGYEYVSRKTAEVSLARNELEDIELIVEAP